MLLSDEELTRIMSLEELLDDTVYDDRLARDRAIARAQHEKDKAEFKKWGEGNCPSSYTVRLRRTCPHCWAELEG